MKNILIIVFALTLTGCGASSPKKVLKDYPVDVSDSVVYLSEAQITDFKDLQDFLFFGHTATDRLNERNAEFDRYVGNLKEQVSEALVREFKLGLRSHSSYRYSPSVKAKAKFLLEIVDLSLVQKNTFSSYYKPNLTVKLSLRDEEGKLVFTELESITAFNERTPEHTLEEYRNSKSKLTKAFMLAAESLVDDLMEEI